MFFGSNQIISRLDSQSKLQMFFTVFRQPCWWSKGLHQHGGSILGSINLRKTFWRISDVLEYAETQNLSKCLFYLDVTKATHVVIADLVSQHVMVFIWLTLSTKYNKMNRISIIRYRKTGSLDNAIQEISLNWPTWYMSH